MEDYSPEVRTPTLPTNPMSKKLKQTRQIINSILQKAHDDPSVNQWWWYLATTSYATAPQKDDEPISKRWTAAPINPSFQSPFVGKTLQDAAHWLRNKPESVALDPHFFGLLDKQAGQSGKVAMCRIGDGHLKGDEVTCILWKAETSTLTLVGQDYGDWDDILAGNVGPYTPDI